MTDYKGKVVIVTGANSGMGLAIARRFVGAGATVVFMGRRQQLLNDVTADLPQEQVVIRPLDVSDRATVNEVVNEIIVQHERVDILVNNAGINTQQRGVADIKPEDWDYVLQVNLTGAFNMIHAVLPTMRSQGNGMIINISSTAGVRASQVAGAAYSASKHAMVSLTNNLNQEEWEYGIRATAICPGEVNTPILDNRAEPPSDERKAQMVQVEDIADSVMYVTGLSKFATVPMIVIKPAYQDFA